LFAESAKRWFKVDVIRRSSDSRGSGAGKTSTQTTVVYAFEKDVVGFAIARCPSTWESGDGDVKTSVKYRLLGSDEGM